MTRVEDTVVGPMGSHQWSSSPNGAPDGGCRVGHDDVGRVPPQLGGQARALTGLCLTVPLGADLRDCMTVSYLFVRVMGRLPEAGVPSRGREQNIRALPGEKARHFSNFGCCPAAPRCPERR